MSYLSVLLSPHSGNCSIGFLTSSSSFWTSSSSPEDHLTSLRSLTTPPSCLLFADTVIKQHWNQNNWRKIQFGFLNMLSIQNFKGLTFLSSFSFCNSFCLWFHRCMRLFSHFRFLRNTSGYQKVLKVPKTIH